MPRRFENLRIARPPERIFDDIVQTRGKGATVRRKLAENRERNWLLALTLHSFAKFADGAQLTDLEGSIVTAFRESGFSDEEIRQQGGIRKRMPREMCDEIFPGRFVQLDSYSFQNMGDDAPDIVNAILAMPCVTRIDMQAIHAGERMLRDFPRPSRAVIRQYAFEMLVVVDGGGGGGTPPPPPPPPGPSFTIKATQFRCNDRADDTLGFPSNEPYWIFGSVGAGVTVTTRSRVFDDVDNGEVRNFAANEGCIWGQNCAARDLPDGDMGALIQLWENDSGDPDVVRNRVAAVFAAALTILAGSGIAAWVSAVVAAVGVVLQWLLSHLDDDHFADQVIVFNRGTLLKQVLNAGDSFDTVYPFLSQDGDANYSLTLRVTHAT